MSQYLWHNSDSLSSLPYQQINLRLVASGIITHDKKREIDQICDNKWQMSSVLSEIRISLFHKQPRKFECFLEILEKSGDQKLEKIAKRLG